MCGIHNFLSSIVQIWLILKEHFVQMNVWFTKEPTKLTAVGPTCTTSTSLSTTRKVCQALKRLQVCDKTTKSWKNNESFRYIHKRVKFGHICLYSPCPSHTTLKTLVQIENLIIVTVQGRILASHPLSTESSFLRLCLYSSLFLSKNPQSEMFEETD